MYIEKKVWFKIIFLELDFFFGYFLVFLYIFYFIDGFLKKNLDLIK